MKGIIYYLTIIMVAAVFTSNANELARHDFPYESKFVQVNGHRIHYVDTGGNGPTVVLLHGQPTWSYLWRNIIPHLEENYRVIAPDLIGFGKSDKPYIDYRLETHADYFAGFMDAIQIDEVVMVVHDWGSFIGLNWAQTHKERVLGLAFLKVLCRMMGSLIGPQNK